MKDIKYFMIDELLSFYFNGELVDSESFNRFLERSILSGLVFDKGFIRSLIGQSESGSIGLWLLKQEIHKGIAKNNLV